MNSLSLGPKRAFGLAVAMLGAAALWTAGPAPAAAHTSVHIGLGFGVPVVPAYPPPVFYYPPPPPPVVYAPPAYYAPPPPPAAYAPPPSAPVAPAQASGQQCREYQTTTTINGRPQQTFGTACLQPDGTWRIVN